MFGGVLRCDCTRVFMSLSLRTPVWCVCCFGFHEVPRLVQGKHVKFSAAVDDEGHGTIKRKPTAFVKMKAVLDDDDDDDDEVFYVS